MSEPTPTPWKVENVSLVVVERAQCRAIKAACAPGLADAFTAFCDGPNRDANADIIVRAVNAHDDLLNALERCAELIGPAGHPAAVNSTAWANARAAIAKARKET